MKNIIFSISLLLLTLLSCSKNKTIPIPINNSISLKENQENDEDTKVIKKNLLSKKENEEVPKDLYLKTKVSYGDTINTLQTLEVPKLINNQIINLRNKSKKIDRYLRYKSIHYLYKRIANGAIGSNDDYEIGDENSIILPKLKPSDLINMYDSIEPYIKDPTLNKLRSSVLLSFDLKSNTEEIKDIKINSYILDEEYNSLKNVSTHTLLRYEDQIEARSIDDVQRSYHIKENNLKTKNFYQQLKKGNRLVFKINDFKLKDDLYSKLHTKAYQQFARVIVSTDSEEDIFYVKEGESLLTALKSQYDSLEVSQNGNIKLLKNLPSAIYQENYFEESRLESMEDLKGWFHFEKDMKQILKKGTNYFVIHSSWKNVLSKISSKSTVKKIYANQLVALKRLKGQEKIYIKLVASNYAPDIKERTITDLGCFALYNMKGTIKNLNKKCSIKERVLMSHKRRNVRPSLFFKNASFVVDGIQRSFLDLQENGLLSTVFENNEYGVYQLDLGKMQINTDELILKIKNYKEERNEKFGSFNKLYTPSLGRYEFELPGFENYKEWEEIKRLSYLKELKGYLWIH